MVRWRGSQCLEREEGEGPAVVVKRDSDRVTGKMGVAWLEIADTKPTHNKEKVKCDNADLMSLICSREPTPRIYGSQNLFLGVICFLRRKKLFGRNAKTAQWDTREV